MKLAAAEIEYDFPEDPTNKQVMDLERAVGVTYDEWQGLLQRGSMLAATGLVYLVRKEAEPDLTFDGVDFNVSTWKLILTDDEKRRTLDALDGEDREKFVKTLAPGEEARLLAEVRSVDPTEAPQGLDLNDS